MVRYCSLVNLKGMVLLHCLLRLMQDLKSFNGSGQPSRRVGVMIYWMPSTMSVMTFYLTAVEPRIKVAVPCITAQNIYDIPGIEVLAPWHYARAVGDRPLLMMMSRHDPYYLVEDAQRLFRLIKSSTKDLQLYEVEGHQLPKEHIPDSIEWFKKYL